MIPLIKNLFLNNKTVKITSLIIGYSLWSFLGQAYSIAHWIEVPLYFYNIQPGTLIESQPEKVRICIQGKRNDLAHSSPLICHIDARDLREGQTILTPTDEQLFLPQSLKLIYCKPQTITVSVQKS